MHETPRSTEWLAWAGLIVASFAVLEHRAIKSNRRRPTLSRVVADKTRRSQVHRAASTALIVGVSAGFAYHVNYEKILEDGTFTSFAALDKLFRSR